LLVRAETPGPVVTKLVPKASQSSKILYGIYFALTVIQVIFLRFTGMPMFDCLVNSFATAGTGGFSVKNLSIGAYASPSAEIIITIFMLLFSLNFAVYFLMLRGKFKQAVESDELKFFVSVVFISTTLISFNIRSFYDTFGEALRSAAFQVASIISTTGFSSADFNLWPELSRTILILLMFCGACAGSTGGAIKCSRVLVVFRYIGRELKQISHPRSVNVVRLDGHVVDEDNLKNIMAFFGAYIFISLGATLLISLDNYSFGTSFTAVVACIGNVGPGLELVGPMGNYSMFSPLSKLVLSLCMVIGRLEIFPILMLLSPKSWHA
ncbi:MAG: potassium transporter TrkG, partial [Oscillospiraceae bacterium]